MISTGSVTDKLLRWLQCRNHNFAKLQYFHQCVNNTVFRVATYRQGMLCLCRINFHKNHYPNNHHCLPAINKTVNRELSTVNYKKQKSRTLLSIRLSFFESIIIKSFFAYFFTIINSERLFSACSASVQPSPQLTLGSDSPYPFPEILSFAIPFDRMY